MIISHKKAKSSLSPPTPEGQLGLRALRAMIRRRSPLAALEIFHRELGDVFKISLPGFNPTLLVGPEANRFVLVEAPGTNCAGGPRATRSPRLLRRGLLVIEWR